MKYDFVRHNGPIDFAKHCKPFEAQSCARCGKTPENPAWSVCNACMGQPITVIPRAEQVKARTVAAEQARRRKKIPKICAVCHKEFGARADDVRVGRGKTCSPSCAGKLGRNPRRYEVTV